MWRRYDPAAPEAVALAREAAIWRRAIRMAYEELGRVDIDLRAMDGLSSWVHTTITGE
jgi:hypothetical protein